MNNKEGWAQPVNSRKFHYFRSRQSLCGHWMFFGQDLDGDKTVLAGECAACRKKLDKEASHD
ncbi:hypothetical protein [Pantoea dispersa]|uniref:hypothetical protein n=1 Tax=Pantoea dispersa TaxID=59814 RepID=UPI0032154115